MRKTIEQAAAERLQAYKSARSQGGVKRSELNGIIAAMTAEEAAGLVGDLPTVYDLDQPHRDSIFVHTRQDASHALLNTITNMKLLLNIRGLLVANFAALVVLSYFVARVQT
jgi:hypothetical protein